MLVFVAVVVVMKKQFIQGALLQKEENFIIK